MAKVERWEPNPGTPPPQPVLFVEIALFGVVVKENSPPWWVRFPVNPHQTALRIVQKKAVGVPQSNGPSLGGFKGQPKGNQSPKGFLIGRKVPCSKGSPNIFFKICSRFICATFSRDSQVVTRNWLEDSNMSHTKSGSSDTQRFKEPREGPENEKCPLTVALQSPRLRKAKAVENQNPPMPHRVD